MDSTVVDKCLAFCQTLASSKVQFQFNLSLGKDTFNFVIKELEKTSCNKKKKTPSQIRREIRRREEFKQKHSDSTDKVEEEFTHEVVDSQGMKETTEDSDKVNSDGQAKTSPGTRSETIAKETTAENSTEAIEIHTPEAPTEKFKCNECDYKNISEKGLAQHIRMKHCPRLELKCFNQEHNGLCCDVLKQRCRGPKVRAPPRVFHPNLNMYGEYNVVLSNPRSSMYTFDLPLPGRPDRQKHLECFHLRSL